MKRTLNLLLFFIVFISLSSMPLSLAAEEGDFTEPGANFEKPVSTEEEKALNVYSQDDSETSGSENQEHDGAVH
ncbi:MAG: hypothetical protein JW984_16300 [Deltaproteobacteria bacterium]|uniref:Secreted protein n=1 Tax=Candidatus Zymogenus saltonus TaxID=2844893 RepID=A0A9D8PRJ7_9DELT|nr:hypothetical protein [Candidatus Zymogenus saltonus]